MRKKLLVIKPPYSTFPVGFAYVLSCLESNNIPFDFIDTELRQEYKGLLRKNYYFAVATGGLIGHFNFFREITNNVRKINPELPIILGGNITKDIRPDFIFDKIGVDYGIIGEAETSLPYLIDNIINNSDKFHEVSGLLYKDKVSGEIKKNPVKRLDLSNNIIPAWHHIDVDYYKKVFSIPFWGNRLAMPVLSGRGCVGRCSFCSPSIGSFRIRPVEHVIQEIEYLNSKYDFEWIVFINEMLYRSKEEILSFCQAYKKIKPMKNWVCSLRVDADIDLDTFGAMKEAGCVSTSAGIESGSNKILKLMNKRTTAEQVIKYFRDTKAAGLPSNGAFLVGNEGETEEDLRQTIDMIINEEMNTTESLTNAYPGTLIYRNALKRGLIDDEWSYLQQLEFGCDIWDRTWTNRRHMNISEIPDEHFWDVIIRELRRFNSFSLNRFKVNDVSYKLAFGALLMSVTGTCPDCGSSVSSVSPYRLMGIIGFCRNCFRRVFFNIYEAKDFKSHFELIVNTLRKTNSLVVFGAEYEAVSLLRFDYFGLNYDKIIGFVDINRQQSHDSHFIHMPRLQIQDLVNTKPDTILIVDDQFGDAELILRNFYIKRDLQLPQIIHLWPDAKRWNIKMIRFFDKYKGGNMIRKAIFSLVIYVILFYSWLKRKVFNALKPTYNTLLRLNQFSWVRPILLKWVGKARV